MLHSVFRRTFSRNFRNQFAYGPSLLGLAPLCPVIACFRSETCKEEEKTETSKRKNKTQTERVKHESAIFILRLI